MEEYAIYLRKSRKDLELESMGEGETLARHKTALLELAQKKELKIVKIYEEMVSGESIEDRPKVQELLDEVTAGKYRGVLVMEIERLARGNTRDQGEVAEAFWGSETLIVTPSKTYDPTNEFDEEYFEFGLFMSRREYKTIRRRMQRGLIASIKEGNYVGSLPPYGYDIIRLNKKERTLKLNDQSEYVKMIYEWFVNNRMTTGEIARKLTLMGVPTKLGKPEWNRSTIKDILTNNLYTGKIRWNRRKTTKEVVEGMRKKVKRRNLSEDYLIVEGKHTAIISQEMFDKAQELFTVQTPVKMDISIRSPFASLIFCKHCGKAICYQSYQTTNATPRMTHRESMTCKVKSAPFSQVLEAVIFALNQYVTDFEFKLNNDDEVKRREQHKEVIESMKSELASLEKKRAGLFDYLERGIYTENEFLERKAVYTERIENLNSNLLKEQNNEPEEIDYQEKIIKFSEVIESLRNPDIPAKKKNDLLKEIVSRIEYDCEDLGRNKGGNVMIDIFLR
jgi:site-specific DNA recombinase